MILHKKETVTKLVKSQTDSFENTVYKRRTTRRNTIVNREISIKETGIWYDDNLNLVCITINLVCVTITPIFLINWQPLHPLISYLIRLLFSTLCTSECTRVYSKEATQSTTREPARKFELLRCAKCTPTKWSLAKPSRRVILPHFSESIAPQETLLSTSEQCPPASKK